MNGGDHVRDVAALQAQIYRAMTPADRLRQAVRLGRQMRSLTDAGLPAEHPEWSDEQRRRVIVEPILYARTG